MSNLVSTQKLCFVAKIESAQQIKQKKKKLKETVEPYTQLIELRLQYYAALRMASASNEITKYVTFLCIRAFQSNSTNNKSIYLQCSQR